MPDNYDEWRDILHSTLTEFIEAASPLLGHGFPEKRHAWAHRASVNRTGALKQPGVWFRQSKDPRDRAAVFHAFKILDKYHGQATGKFTCDEHLPGRNLSQGTELCTVVETMFSLEVLLAILDDPELADRLERITFNALPGTFKPDMCVHHPKCEWNYFRPLSPRSRSGL